MKVTIELDPKDWWHLAERAEAAGVPLADFVKQRIAGRPEGTKGRVRDLWAEGLCDADVASALDIELRTAKNVRLGLGLPANRRYPRRAA